MEEAERPGALVTSLTERMCGSRWGGRTAGWQYEPARKKRDVSGGCGCGREGGVWW